MRILVLSMRIPFPANGGEKITMYNYLKTMNKLGYEIDLICFDDELLGNYKEKIKDIKKQFMNIKNIEIIKVDKIHRIIGSLITLLQLKPMQLGYFSNIFIKRTLNKSIRFENYDKIFVHTIRLTGLLPKEYLKKSIVLYADSIARNYEKSKDYVGNLKKILFTIEFPLIKKYEKELSKNIYKGIFHNTIDVEYLSINNCITIPILKPKLEKFISIDENTKKRFILIGKYSYFPNVRAIEYILENKKGIEESNFSIDIIGGSLDKKYIDEIEKLKNINYLGFVDNCNKEMIDSYGVLCPVNVGAGMQNKILDAFVNGRPAISSEFSAYPYKVFIKEKYNKEMINEIITYKNSSEFIKILNKIISNFELANSYAKKSYELSNLFDLKLLEKEIEAIF
ncbi:glycosyltransferase [Haliovirga abyssi]|uniref:Glycosyltransferase n=1 Tax=Haliovirga abyssi TaxID=2996794 RepID=A0AAU9D9U3_9FUSO|nr:glycosyltransferase [Haliovirga abyssi]BDU51408.1 hypothetical protein HLVA_19770 [Haliovirga abyssi]